MFGCKTFDKHFTIGGVMLYSSFMVTKNLKAPFCHNPKNCLLNKIYFNLFKIDSFEPSLGLIMR